MSYKWTSGSVRRGDIYAQEDTTGDATYIDWGQDTITLRPSASATMFLEDGKVGIRTTTPTAVLDVSGSMRVDYDTDTTSYVGRAAVGSLGHSDYAGFSHLDNTGPSYALLQSSAGFTYLNCASGQKILFRANNVDQMTMKANGNFGIGTSDPDYALDVAGNVGFDEYIYHNGDTDTYIQFAADEINFVAGAANMIYMNEGGGGDQADKVAINNDLADVDFQVKGASEANLIRTEAATDRVGIGTSTPTATLYISGSDSANLFGIRSDSNIDLFVVTGSGNVGIGTPDPKVALDVHDDPTALSNDTGGGTVVKFGTDAALTAGKVYYFHTNGVWTETDADAVGTGADQLLGISLGADATIDGILIQGFFDATTYLSNFSTGKAVYLSTTAAEMDTIPPAGTGDFVRVVGWCTDTANVIYFNPSGDWVELA